jgi:mRNA-degrading endonuclease toxin of MazEF toxin-antitoxin module
MQSDGMPSDCVANLDNIQTIAKSELYQKIVRLRHERMEEIFDAIKVAFDMSR